MDEEVRVERARAIDAEIDKGKEKFLEIAKRLESIGYFRPIALDQPVRGSWVQGMVISHPEIRDANDVLAEMQAQANDNGSGPQTTTACNGLR